MSDATSRPEPLVDRLRAVEGVCDVRVLDSVDSTNDEIWRLGGRPGTVVIAREQTRGRGRRGNRWLSPRGTGLYVSTCLASDELRVSTRWTIGAAVAACESCRRLGVRGIDIDWPNDLVIAGRKAAGILVEARRGQAGEQVLVAGTGFNVTAIPAGDEAHSRTCLTEHADGIDHDTLARTYVKNLMEIAALLSSGQWAEIRNRYLALCPMASSKRVLVRRGDDRSAWPGGETTGIDDIGALVVTLDSGDRVSVQLTDGVEPVGVVTGEEA